MQNKSGLIRIKHKTLLYLVTSVLILGIATPVLADYLGPDRTSTESYVDTYDYGVWARANNKAPYCLDKNGNIADACIICDWERKPGNACGDATYSYKLGTKSEVVTKTIDEPPATISGLLQNCALSNGWCVTTPQLSLSANEPLSGYNILAIEGSYNGQTFACTNSTCNIPLNEGDNNFTFWALSSWGDSSTMGTINAKVDSQLPSITGTFSGISGANGWYISSLSFNGNALDTTSGLASFTCTLDGAALGSCNSIIINGEGAHTLVLTARDNAGNTRILNQNASVDLQNPTLSASLSGTLGANNWHTTAVLNASASDPNPGSGLSVFEYNLDNGIWTTFPASGVLTLPDGKHSVDLRAVDSAGHVTTSSKSFWLDSLAPTVAINLNGTLGSKDWYTTNLTLTASGNDETSGLDVFEYSLDNSAWINYTTPLTLGEGAHNLSFWAQDSAGLVTQVDRTYQIDTRVPQIAGTLSGVPGMNGWYISNVTFTASASDPLPGSGLDTFTYTLNNSVETPYTDALTLTDGEHKIQLNAQDKAGLTYSREQAIKVDTIAPSLNIQNTIPNWVKDSVTLNGISNDSGSGLSKVEISTDSGQTWQIASGTNSWSYVWDTTQGSSGIREAHVRVIDNSGLTTEQTFNVGVDNNVPKISLPDSWYQWDTITLDIWDNDSGLSEARIEISDPEGRWPTRKINLDLNNFPLDFKWDRRFGDGTIAPLGTYSVKIIAFDNLGNMARQNSSINILLGFLSAGVASTSQPYVRVDSPQTPITTATSISSSAVVAQNAVVSAFGVATEPVTQTTPVPEIISTPRTAPTQTKVLDWLQSIFTPNENHESVIEIVASAESKSTTHSTTTDNNSVLWGATAAAAIGVATAYALDEKRKRKEEEAKQIAEIEAKAAKLNAVEEARKAVAAWLESQAILNAQELKEQELLDLEITETRMERIEAREDARWLASQVVIQNRAEDKKRAEEEQARLTAYYTAMRQREQQVQTNWWEETKSFVKEQIVQPVNTYIYQPYIKPTIEKTTETLVVGAEWANEKVYQPYIKPKVDNAFESATRAISWGNEHIYQPYIKPVVDKTIEAITAGISWANENVYQPHIVPKVAKAVESFTSTISWVNETIYQPYIKPNTDKVVASLAPGISWVSENIYQPYIEPRANKALDMITDSASWINKNIYEPFIEPVANDINQYIYQPLIDKTQSAWNQYGEWVHGSLDAAGFIPGLGEIADGLNGLIYLGEGRYMEASVSALAMIPLLGDFGKAGKWGITIGKEVLEETAEKVVKEAAEELTEKVIKESAKEVTEKVVKETGEEIIEKAVDEIAEKTIKDVGQELSEKVVKESLEKVGEEISTKATKEALEEIAEKAIKDTSQAIPSTSIDKASKEVSEKLVGQVLEKVDDKTAALFRSVADIVGDDAVSINKATTLIQKYGDDAIKALTAVKPEAAAKVLRSVDESILDDIIRQGSDAFAAFSGWTEKELKDHGKDLVARATKDAEVLNDVKTLVSKGPIDPKNLTKEQKFLIDKIAANSTFIADGKQIVVGKWVGLDGGFLKIARETNSLHYSPHPDLWGLFKGLENQNEAAWLINQKVIQNGVGKGLPFEYTLDGIPEKILDNERDAVDAIFSGKPSDDEIMQLLKSDYIPVRIRELQELSQSGYKLDFNDASQSYILSLKKGI